MFATDHPDARLCYACQRYRIACEHTEETDQ